MLTLSLLAVASLSAQEPPVQKRDETEAERNLRLLRLAAAARRNFRAAEWLIDVDPVSGRQVLLFWGNVRGTYNWRRDTVRLEADRVVVLLERGAREGGSGGAGDAGATPGGETPRNSGDGAARGTAVSFYAEGNVQLQSRDMVLELDAFFYDHERESGVAVRARGHGKLSAVDRLRKFLNSRELSMLRTGGPIEEEGPTLGPAASPDEAGPPQVEPPPPGTPGERVEGTQQAVTRTLRPGESSRRTLYQLAFVAERLRVLDLRTYEGEGLVISSCEYGVPHYGIHAGDFRIRRVGGRDREARAEPGEPEEEKEAGEGEDEAEPGGEEEEPAQDRDREPQHFVIDPEGSWLSFYGVPVLPFPVGLWNTRWISYNPISDVSYSNSSKFGNRVEVDWNLVWLLKKLPGSELRPVEEFLDRAQIDAITDYQSKRGLGYGVQGIYGEEPRDWTPWELNPGASSYHGEGIYYRIDDRGEDRTAPRGAGPIDDERWWGRIIHRQRLPHVGVLDVEYSEWSDENFLREYFPFTRTEKEQENIVYFRRALHDNVAVTGLYKYRLNSFETTTERMPEARFHILEQPILHTGLYSTLSVQAAQLRRRPADELDERTRTINRLDTLNEWSYPLRLDRYLQVRPFAGIRYTAYETGLDPEEHSLDRAAFSAGVRASQQWSRIFQMPRGGWMERWFGITTMKHDIIPEVTYFNLFSSDLDPDELLQLDPVDEVSELEVTELSLRNILWIRGVRKPTREGVRHPYRGIDAPRGRAAMLRQLEPVESPHALLDAEASLRWFTHPARDNRGDRFSALDLDVALYPLKYLAIRSRNFLDTGRDLDPVLTDNSVTVLAVPDALHFTVGQRFRDGLSEFYYGRVGLNLGRRYALESYYGFDSRETDRTDLEVRLIRFFHRFALELSYSFDAGESDNQSFGVNFYPVELLEETWNRRIRRNFR